MGRETISFNDPRFVAVFNSLIADMKSLWRCDGIVFIVAGSGTMAMEMGICNVAGTGENVLVCSNGHFGDRFIDICARKNFSLDTIKAQWGTSVTVDEIDKKLSEKKYSALVTTHIETSTGVELPLRQVAEMVRRKHPDVILVVDGVASAGASEFYMDWGIDVMLTCSQKGLGISPGLGIIWASQRAIDKRQSMPPISESYADFVKWIPVMKDTMQYWGTPSVNMIWALAEAIRIIKDEGLEERIKRHKLFSDAIRSSLSALGFRTGTEEALASPSVTVFFYPENPKIDDAAFRSAVYEEGAHIGGCLGVFAGKGFRIGHMGNITTGTLVTLIAAIERACIRCGYDVALGSGLAAMQKAIVSM
jgi:aspartate aminotransferase-like enzyme